MKKADIYKFLLVISALIVHLSLSAQAYVITGIVKDFTTLQPISFCSIKLAGFSSGTTSNAQGRFTISLSQDVWNSKLVVSSLNYFTDTIQLFSEKNEYSILLKPSIGFLNEVVVTGILKATPEKESPIPINTVSLKKIELTNESNIIDVLVKNVPGLNAVKTGPNISKPFIRGLGYNRILTLYDGIRQEGQQWGDEHGIEVDAYNIERGEVIKGPASLMYGSDALAGVVSLIPSLPHETDSKIHGRILSEYQNNNGLTGEGLRLNYANNHWTYVLRASCRIAKNYTNDIDGRIYNTAFRESNASATIKHTGKKGYSDLNITLYNNLQGIPDGSRDSLTRKFTKQIYEGLLDDIKNRPLVSDEELNSYKLSPLHQRIQHYRIYSNNHYELRKGDVDFLLAFQQNIRREYNHPTDPKQAGLFVRLNTINYGFRYHAPEIVNTNITIGINGMYQDNKSKDATDFPIPDYNLLDAGGYVYARWKQNKWTISGGIRYDIRYLKGNDFYTVTDSITMFSKKASLPDTSGAYLRFPAFDKTFNGTSLSLGTTYEINKNISLKANIARGYRAPNITEFASNGLDPGAHIIYLGNRNFIPEFSLQEDIGAELFYKDFAVTISMFNNNIQNYIYLSQLTDASGNPVTNAQGDRTYQYQQASAQLYGMEISESFHPSVFKGFSFDNSFSVIYGYNRQINYKNKRNEGEYLPLIPPAKLISSLNRQIKIQSGIASSINLRAEMEYNAAQNRYLALNNTETATPSYAIFNFSVNAQINCYGSNNMQFQFQVNNAFDKAYESNLSRLKYFEYYSSSPNGHLGMFNMGRNFCLKAILLF